MATALAARYRVFLHQNVCVQDSGTNDEESDEDE